MFDKEKVIKAVESLLDGFGVSKESEIMKETPKRVSRYWEELLEGSKYTNQEIAEMYGKKFEVDEDPLVVKVVDNVYSHCEHHLALMYNMKVVVAYLPTKKSNGRYEVIGLSKIPRIVKLCAKRLQLQEKLAEDVAECIQIATGSKDVYVNIVADHACVSARGSNSEGATDTTVMRGSFRDNKELRDEVERKAMKLVSF